MKIAKFRKQEHMFNANKYLAPKFDYHTPIQVIAAVPHRWEGTRYLVVKHKPHGGSANFSWFTEDRFQSLAPGVTYESLKKIEGDNPYYWIHEEEIQMMTTDKDTTKTTLSGMVLKKFEEEDE